MSYVALIIALFVGAIGVALPTQPHETSGKRSLLGRIRPGGWWVIGLLFCSLAVGAWSQSSKDQETRQEQAADSLRYKTTIGELNKQREDAALQYATTTGELLAQRMRDSVKLLEDSTRFGWTFRNIQLQLAKQDSLLSSTNVQLQRQRESLQMLRRSLTRFDRLGFLFQFRYPADDSHYRSYVDNVRRQAQAALDSYVRRNGYRPIRPDGTVEWRNYDTIWSVSGRWDRRGDSAIVDQVDIGPESPWALHADALRRTDLHDLLGQATVNLSFFRTDTLLTDADLRLQLKAWNPESRSSRVGTHSLTGADPAAIRLLIDFKGGFIQQTLYTSTYERSDGGVTNEIISIEDLAGSTLVIAREDVIIDGLRVGERARLAGFEILWGPDRSNRVVLHSCRLQWQPAASGTRRVVYRFSGDESGIGSPPAAANRSAATPICASS